MPLCRLSSSLHNRRIVQIKPDDLPVVDNKSMPVVYPVPSKIVCLLMDAWHEGLDNRGHCSGDAASRRWDEVCVNGLVCRVPSAMIGGKIRLCPSAISELPERAGVHDGFACKSSIVRSRC